VYRGVGYIHTLSKDIWPGHPCCSLATSRGFIDNHPNTYRAMLRSVLEAELALHRADAEERKAIAREISGPDHLNQDNPIPVEQALSGDFPDGAGHHRNEPDRIDFLPCPWPEYGTWMLSQMQRWSQLPGKISYTEIVESIFQDDSWEIAEALGFRRHRKPQLKGTDYESRNPFAYMRNQPFCQFLESPRPRRKYESPESIRQRLGEIVRRMAEVAGGRSAQQLQITSDGELGELEQTLNELILNMTFSKEALAEKRDRLEKEVDERTAALRESEQRFRAVADSANDAIVMIDNDRNISMWNKAAERMFGYKAEEVIGSNPHRLLTPERFHGEHFEAFAVFRETGKGNALGKTLELPGVRKNGEEFPAELSLSAIMLDKEWNAVGIVRDVTERKEAEGRLKQAKMDLEAINAQLEQQTARANAMAVEAQAANEAKSEFLANMSHEIRTPMNGVIGMTDLLLNTELTDEQREYGVTIRKSGDALLSIINDILDFSKIEAGKLDSEVLDFDLFTTLEDVSEMLAHKAHQKGLEFICSTDPGVPSLLQGDPGRLRQVLANLTSNAIKFTSEGEVAICVSLENEDDEKATIRFTVRDTGIGIPEDRQEALFSPFTQADGSTTRKFGGTGLGLSISRRLVEMMGGEIGVESEEGQGSEFWFTAVFVKQAGVPERPVAIVDSIGDKRILVVDDNATNRRVLTQTLHSWGCRYDEAASGEAALLKLTLGLAENDPFRFVILDMLMPGMDGEELGTRIKQDPQLRDLLLLVMLGSSGGCRDAARLREIGFSAYLTKPVIQSQLYDALMMIINHGPCERECTCASLVTGHAIAEARRRKVRILLVEDNISNQRVALAITRGLGYRADAVANGIEAIKALETLPYDLVFMDCQMPEMDGYEATARIRDESSSVRRHDIPIIALTANAMKGDREKCIAAGMDDYVPKPVKCQDLSAVIKKWTFGLARSDPDAQEGSAQDDGEICA
ncbi:MAG: response regulator, partial [Candidatus Eisenbacteria sp.]|nr:response regulator [Candidatus Eisenbacteria bacterium]